MNLTDYTVAAVYKYCCVLAGIYCYVTHLVVTVDIMGVIVRKDVRDKIIIYAGTSVIFPLS